MTNCATDYQVLYCFSKFLYQTANIKQKLLKLLHFAGIQYVHFAGIQYVHFAGIQHVQYS